VGDDLIRQSNFYPSNNANTIAGGQGNDRMESGGSPDTYLFARGDGHDTIRDWDFYGWGDKLDRVVFGAGIAAGDVAVSRSGNHLVLKVNDPANPAAVDQVTIENWNINRLYRLEQVVFADGTTWSTAQLSALAVTVTGTDGADTIGGWSVADIIYGLDGNDAITDLDGNDLLNGGRGNDTLDGGAGNDLFIGASGDDLIVADSIAFNRGDGQDVIAASAGKDNILS
jgi:Ca2+-binding RTX toxin-like protein